MLNDTDTQNEALCAKSKQINVCWKQTSMLSTNALLNASHETKGVGDLAR